MYYTMLSFLKERTQLKSSFAIYNSPYLISFSAYLVNIASL